MQRLYHDIGMAIIGKAIVRVSQNYVVLGLVVCNKCARVEVGLAQDNNLIGQGLIETRQFL